MAPGLQNGQEKAVAEGFLIPYLCTEVSLEQGQARSN